MHPLMLASESGNSKTAHGTKDIHFWVTSQRIISLSSRYMPVDFVYRRISLRTRACKFCSIFIWNIANSFRFSCHLSHFFRWKWNSSWFFLDLNSIGGGYFKGPSMCVYLGFVCAQRKLRHKQKRSVIALPSSYTGLSARSLQKKNLGPLELPAWFSA